MRFEEFELTLLPAADGVQVSVSRSSSGEAYTFNARLPPAEDAERLAAAFARACGGRDFELAAADEEDLERLLEEFGRRLGAALFAARVGERWAVCHGRGVRPETPLRLRLKMPLDGAGGARLHAVPWESLRLPGGGAAAVDGALSLVRHVAVPGSDRPPPRPAALVVLVVAAQAPGRPRLDLAAEVAALRRHGGRGLRVEVLPGASLEALAERLARGPVHVLHLLGHGNLDDAGRGVVHLRRPGGGADAVTGERLATVLQGAESLRLLVLNACHTAAAAAAAPFAGVATAAIRQAGVPAVVAMQYPIPDRAAIRFAAEFYRRLAAGEGLDRAVTAGRRRLHADGSPAWVVPVLFSRLAGGELFAAAPAGWRLARAVRGAASRAAALLLVALLAAWGAWQGAGGWPAGAPHGELPVSGQAVSGQASRGPVASEPPGAPAAAPTADASRSEDGAPGAGEEVASRPPVDVAGTPNGGAVPPDETRVGGMAASKSVSIATEPASDLVADRQPRVRIDRRTDPSTAPPAEAARPHSLTCGETVRFAGLDALANCTPNSYGGERFITLRLTYAGRTGTRAVLAAQDVTFDELPGVVVTVLDLDLDHHRLQLLPPRRVGL